MPPNSVACKDKTKREHFAKVDRVVFASEADDYVILALTDGSTAKGPASAAAFAPSLVYRFLGQWEDDAKYGPWFRFKTYVLHAAHGRAGVVKYLVDICEGIGTKTAERMFTKLGPDTVQMLRDSPREVAEKCGLDATMCEAASLELTKYKRYEGTRIDLFELFDRRGFTGQLIADVIDKWGVRAPAVIRRNPFALLGMGSAGFKRCDKMWCDFGLPKHSPKRQMLCAWNSLKFDGNGHTWMEAAILAEKLREAIPTADPKRAFRLGIRARKIKVHRDSQGKVWLAEYGRATAEERIVAAVSRLMQGVCQWPVDSVPVSKVEGDRLPTLHQVKRLKLATAGAVGLFMGGPGTGKTHSLAFLLKEIVAEYGRSSVAVCAPTGMAANRATRSLAAAGVDIQGKTIHGTLKIGQNGHGGDGWKFEHNRANPLPFRFIIVDESSMIDTDLMADLLDACGVGTHVLFVGDSYQLPPVGHGAPLRDLIDAGVPRGELTVVQRNAGQIVHACARIKNGESFETTDTIDLEATPPRNLRLIEAKDAAHAVEVLMKGLAGFTRFNPVWQTQVIVARNAKGEVCRKKLNERLHPMLNPDGYSIAGNPFKVGDKIICLRNSRMHRVEPIGEFHEDYRENMEREAGNYQVVVKVDEEGKPTRDPEEVFVANGEIGRAVAIAGKLVIARFSEGESLVKIPLGKERSDDGPEADGDADQGRGCNFDHAYAITVHKAQGSESPCVIVMADPDAGMICERSWWYTAISRASKLCILIGQKGWIDKQRVRQAIMRRKTFLKELLGEVLTVNNDKGTDRVNEAA